MSRESGVTKATALLVICGLFCLGIIVVTLAALPKPAEVRSRSEDVARRWAALQKRPIQGVVCADYRDVEGKATCAIIFAGTTTPTIIRCLPYAVEGGTLCETESR